MFAKIMQPNMNGVGETPLVSNIQVNNVNGQNSFDPDSFIKILTAIVSGFNNAIAGSQLSVAGVQSSINGNTITHDDVLKGLFVDNDELAVTGETLSGILQQMITQLSVASSQLPVASSQLPVASSQLPVASSQLSVASSQLSVASSQLSVASSQLSVASSQLPVASCQLPVASSQTNANSDGSAFVQIEAMTNQQPQVSMPENKIAQLPSSGAESKNTAIDAKQAAQPDLRLANGHENNYNRSTMSLPGLIVESRTKELDSLAKPENDGLKIFSKQNTDSEDPLLVTRHSSLNAASQVYNAPYVENDSAIVVKEPIHVSRLNELGEVMEKTIRAGDKHLIIKIEPPDMGSIQIKLRMDNGILRADLKVDSPVVKDLFSMAIPQIKTSLEDSGIKVSDFFVDVKEDYYSDGRRQQDDANQQQHKQNKGSKSQFFDYFA